MFGKEKRWSRASDEDVDTPDIDEFLTEVIDVCKRFNMSIGHEDGHGAFLVRRGFCVDYAEWLWGAGIDEPRD